MEKIKFDYWKKIDLRIGMIKAVKEHPNANKLYILLVGLGKGEHDIQLVAGLKNHYKEKELLNRKIVVIRNLEPAMIRGIESQGMLLAAVFNDDVVLLFPEKDIEVGAKIE